MSSFLIPPLLADLHSVLVAQNKPLYLVGGAVRDAVLGRPSNDLDFATPANAIKLSFKIGDALGVPAYPLDRERDVGRVVLSNGNMIDIAHCRVENQTAKIRTNDPTDQLRADLRDRDFTINALALPVSDLRRDAIIDPTGGLADLTAGIVRATHDRVFQDDPIRTLRAIRMAIQFDFAIAPETAAQLEADKQTLTRVSAERIRDEWLKSLMLPNRPHKAIRLLDEHGLLSLFLPEVSALAGVTQSPPHYEDVLGHTLSVVRWLLPVEQIIRTGSAANPTLTDLETILQPHRTALAAHLDTIVDGGLSRWTLLRVSALLHDIGKAPTRTVEPNGRIRFLTHEHVGADLATDRLAALKFSNRTSEQVHRIIKGHMRPLHLSQKETISKRNSYRYFKKADENAGLDILLHAVADNLAKFNGTGEPARWQRLCNTTRTLLDRFYSEPETVKPPRLISGSLLIQELNLTPGPQIGDLLRALEEAQAVGEIHTTADALDYARRLHQSANR